MHGILGMSGLLLKTRSTAASANTPPPEKLAESLLTIINDILDFSKIEAGKLSIEQVAFSPVALLQGVVALFQARALEKNLRLTLSLPDNPPAALLATPPASARSCSTWSTTPSSSRTRARSNYAQASKRRMMKSAASSACATAASA